MRSRFASSPDPSEPLITLAMVIARARIGCISCTSSIGLSIYSLERLKPNTFVSRMKFEVLDGETEHISLSGKRKRARTVLIRVGRVSISKQALTLGIALALCQVFDGILTFLGLYMVGTEMEGNRFLRELMSAYGTAPILFTVKTAAFVLVVLLTFHAHSRTWIRPLIFMLVVIYLALAVIPWVYIISDQLAVQGR